MTSPVRTHGAMIGFMLVLTLCVLLTPTLGLEGRWCPHRCYCSNTYNGKIIRCVARGLTSIPEISSGRVYILNVTLNQIHIPPTGKLGQNGVSLEKFAMAFNKALFDLPKDFFSYVKDSLRVLDMSNNRLVEILPAILELEQLEKLDLSDNELSRLSDRAFATFPRLKSLGLVGNPIMEVGEQTFLPTSSLTELSLTLEGPALQSESHARFSKHLGKVEDLELKYVDLENADEETVAVFFSDFKQLKTLAIELSPEFATSVIDGKGVLDASKDTLVYLSLTGSVVGKKIPSALLEQLPQIRTLDLSSNHITDLNLEPCDHGLRKLYLNNNDIGSTLNLTALLTRTCFPGLMELHLRNNSIRYVEAPTSCDPGSSERLSLLLYGNKFDCSDCQEIEWASPDNLDRLTRCLDMFGSPLCSEPKSMALKIISRVAFFCEHQRTLDTYTN